MHTINIPIKNTWGHLLCDCDKEKKQRINTTINKYTPDYTLM
jgi:hypothetical protein